MYAAVHTPGAADPARLLRCASDFSPCFEATAPDTAVIPVAGLAHLFGGSAREIAVAIERHAATLGLQANVAVAANPDLAIHGARGFEGATVMEPGREASLPIEILGPDAAVIDTLTLWGIRTFGDLAALPADGVTARLGPDGARLHTLARGAGDRPLVAAFSPPRFEESLELEDPVTLLEPLSFLLGRLLGAVCTHLESHGLATHELRLTLALEKAEPHVRTLRLPYPMRDSRVFLKLLTLDIEQHPPLAPILGVTLTAEPVNPRVVQHGLFLPLAPEPQKLELTLARITKLVGEGNVGSPELVNTHRPRAFRMQRFISGAPKKVGKPGRRPGLCLRMFRPALRAGVQAAEGQPVRVTARGVGGRVLESAGPWRTSGDWWRDDGWSRDEWDVALSNGSLYLLTRDRRDGAWFLEGVYD